MGERVPIKCVDRAMAMRLILSLLFCLGACAALATPKKLVVSMDERMEMLNVIQYLSEYPILNQNDSLRYKRDIARYFSGFRDHEAVKLHRSIYRRMFGFDAPVTYMLHQSVPGFEPVADFSKDDIESYGFDVNRDTLRLLMHAFKDFYRQSRFKEFFQSQRPFYQSICRQVEDSLNRYDVIGTMERHYGQRKQAYKVLLCPLMHDGGYAVDVATKGRHEYYAVTGPMSDTIGSMPQFDAQVLLSELVLHEFSHNFCNPVVDKYWDRLKDLSCLMKPIVAAMKEQGYSTWKVCLYEHLVRANEIVLNEQRFGRERADELYREFLEEGHWIYLKGMLPILREQYIRNRKRYPQLEGVMPMLVKYLELEAGRCR
jgi:hypothetical protein